MLRVVGPAMFSPVSCTKPLRIGTLQIAARVPHRNMRFGVALDETGIAFSADAEYLVNTPNW